MRELSRPMSMSLPTATEVPALRPGECQVWWAGTSDNGQALLALLDDAELARWQAFRHAPSQRLYLTAHALARLVLEAHTGVDARLLRITAYCRHCESADHGKPQLTPSDGLEWSLSHSGDKVVVAVVRGTSVGVDVETVPVDADDLPLAALSPAERVSLNHEDNRPHAFARYWTRKEAVLKATGHGLVVDPALLTVTGPHAPPALVAWAASGIPPGQLSLVDLRAPDGYAACVAVVGPPIEVTEASGDGLLRRVTQAVRPQ